jgi:hypothetical protein
MTVPHVTPEQKRRSLLTPEPVFTAVQAGVEVQRRFLFLQRLFFSLAVLVGLGSMWVVPSVLSGIFSNTHWIAFGGALLCFAVTLIVRRRYSGTIQTLFFYLGFLGLGAGVGYAFGPNNRMALMNMTILVGSAMLGGLLNAAVTTRRAPSPYREFLLTGPWLLAGVAVAFVFFPAGEWALLVSGIAALVILFFIHQATLESLERFTPREALVAAADIIPITVLSTWRRVSGEA